MKKRLPLEWKGHPVRITHVAEIMEYRPPDDRQKGGNARRLWEHLKRTRQQMGEEIDPKWTSLQPTLQWKRERLKRCAKGLRALALLEGLKADTLSIVMTEREGICFKWWK